MNIQCSHTKFLFIAQSKHIFFNVSYSAIFHFLKTTRNITVTVSCISMYDKSNLVNQNINHARDMFSKHICNQSCWLIHKRLLFSKKHHFPILFIFLYRCFFLFLKFLKQHTHLIKSWNISEIKKKKQKRYENNNIFIPWLPSELLFSL